MLSLFLSLLVNVLASVIDTTDCREKTMKIEAVMLRSWRTLVRTEEV